MALTYVLTSSSYDGRYLQVICSQNPNPSANTSTISWTLRSVGGSVNYYTTGPTTLVINGNTVYSKERTKWESETFPAAKGSVSGSLVVSHGDDGSLTVPETRIAVRMKITLERILFINKFKTTYKYNDYLREMIKFA
jgi:hypothetical protein